MSAAPPIIRHASNFRRDLELAVLRFPRRHRYVIGQELRMAAQLVAKLANKAWRRPLQRQYLVSDLDEAVDDLKLSMQLAKDLHAFASFAQFEDLARKLSELGRKVSGFTWSRVPGAAGTITYRLFRRDSRGALHCAILRFEPDKQDPRAMAAALRRKRHDLRNQVDTIDLHLLGVTQ